MDHFLIVVSVILGTILITILVGTFAVWVW